MNYSLQLLSSSQSSIPMTFQKNMPNCTLLENMDNDNMSFGFDENKIDAIKKCINFEQFQTLNIKCFISFDNMNGNMENFYELTKTLIAGNDERFTLPANHEKFSWIRLKSNNAHVGNFYTIASYDESGKCYMNEIVDGLNMTYHDCLMINAFMLNHINPSCHIKIPDIAKTLDNYDSVITFHKYFKWGNSCGCSIIMFCCNELKMSLTNNSITMGMNDNSYYLYKFSDETTIVSQWADTFRTHFDKIGKIDSNLKFKDDIISYFGNVVQKRTYQIDLNPISNINDSMNIHNALEYIHSQRNIRDILKFTNDDIRDEYDYIVRCCTKIFYTANKLTGATGHICMYFCEINNLKSDIAMLKNELNRYIDIYGRLANE